MGASLNATTAVGVSLLSLLGLAGRFSALYETTKVRTSLSASAPSSVVSPAPSSAKSPAPSAPLSPASSSSPSSSPSSFPSFGVFWSLNRQCLDRDLASSVSSVECSEGGVEVASEYRIFDEYGSESNRIKEDIPSYR